MSRIQRPVTAERGTECFCGSEICKVPLPAVVAGLFDCDWVWVHVRTGNSRCYPESGDPEDEALTAAPADEAPAECQGRRGR